MFSPTGTADAVAHVYGPDADVQADVDVDLAGKASLSLRPSVLNGSSGDPGKGPEYRVDEMSGHLRAVGETLKLDTLRGHCGNTRLQVDGSVAAFRHSRTPDIDLALQVEGLELNEKLAQSLEGEAGQIFKSFHPSGAADLSGTVRHSHGRIEDFDLTATLKGVDINYDGFPYPLRNATGGLRLGPRCVIVDQITGAAGDGVLKVSGQIRPGLSGRHRFIV